MTFQEWWAMYKGERPWHQPHLANAAFDAGMLHAAEVARDKSEAGRAFPAPVPPPQTEEVLDPEDWTCSECGHVRSAERSLMLAEPPGRWLCETELRPDSYCPCDCARVSRPAPTAPAVPPGEGREDPAYAMAAAMLTWPKVPSVDHLLDETPSPVEPPQPSEWPPMREDGAPETCLRPGCKRLTCESDVGSDHIPMWCRQCFNNPALSDDDFAADERAWRLHCGVVAPQSSGGARDWRVGRKIGRTLYIGETLIGLMDSEVVAAEIVQTMNERPCPSDGSAFPKGDVAGSTPAGGTAAMLGRELGLLNALCCRHREPGSGVGCMAVATGLSNGEWTCDVHRAPPASPRAEPPGGPLTIREAQRNQPWTVPYGQGVEEARERGLMPHVLASHCVLHVAKTAGKLAAVFEALDHESQYEGEGMRRQTRRLSADQLETVTNMSADLFTEALRFANLYGFDLEAALLRRRDEKNGTGYRASRAAPKETT